MDHHKLTSFGIPQDVLDKAKEVGMAAEDLLKLCVEHTVDAAHDWLNWISSKLPGHSPDQSKGP